MPSSSRKAAIISASVRFWHHVSRRSSLTAAPPRPRRPGRRAAAARPARGARPPPRARAFGVALLLERHLDAVEVARAGHVREARARLLLDEPCRVARREVDEGEQADVGLGGELRRLARRRVPGLAGRAASAWRNVASCTSGSAPVAAARMRSDRPAVARTTRRPGRASPTTSALRTVAPPGRTTSSPRWSARRAAPRARRPRARRRHRSGRAAPARRTRRAAGPRWRAGSATSA